MEFQLSTGYVNSIFPTAQAWLDILENALKQIKDMDHIFHFFKPEKTFIEMWKWSSKSTCLFAYITRAGTS